MGGGFDTAAMLVPLLLVAPACREPRSWALAPTHRTTTTLRASGEAVRYVRVELELPEQCAFQMPLDLHRAVWLLPAPGNGHAPRLELSTIPWRDERAGCGPDDDVLERAQPSNDIQLYVRGHRSADRADVTAVDRYIEMRLAGQPEAGVWCHISFPDPPLPQDVDDAMSICGSLRAQADGTGAFLPETSNPGAPSGKRDRGCAM